MYDLIADLTFRVVLLSGILAIGHSILMEAKDLILDVPWDKHSRTALEMLGIELFGELDEERWFRYATYFVIIVTLPFLAALVAYLWPIVPIMGIIWTIREWIR